jgi:hypothetical protein
MVAYERLTKSSLFSAAWGRSFVSRLKTLDKPEFVTNHRNADQMDHRNDMVLDD